MLHDLFMVELYFEPHTHGHKIDDVVKHYGAKAVEVALHGGMLDVRDVKCSRQEPAKLCFLSRQARMLIQKQRVQNKLAA